MLYAKIDGTKGENIHIHNHGKKFEHTYFNS